MNRHHNDDAADRTTRVETLIIGAGQAGLAVGYHLQRERREFLILDRNERVGDGWRHQWDTLRLYTPAKYDGLPGMPFPGSPWNFPLKDEVADYLEAYAQRFELPVRTGVRVEHLTATPGGADDVNGYIATAGVERFVAKNVVVATGTFGRTPLIPPFSADLDPDILQLHSSEYRRPEQLREGSVLVVGASHSGTDIAYEVSLSHPTVLCGPDCGQIPMRLESPLMHVAFPVLIFAWRHVLTRRTPIGRRQMNHVRFHGGPMLRVKRQDLAERGVERRLERVTGVRDGRPVLADGSVLDVANVVWCTGFQQVFDWIDVPIMGTDGWPQEYRGVVERAPGLYFCGLSFQYAFASMVLPGVSRDAAHVADLIAA